MNFNLNLMYPMQPEITVLMSCYNAERWIREAIDSILSQTYNDFELILIDDGSKDKTLDLIREYEKLDKRIRVIAKINTGLPDSLNVGIFQARGKWIARLDADDICEPSRLEEQLQFVKNNPQVVLLGTEFLEIDDIGNIIRIRRYPHQDRRLKSRLRRCKQFFPHSSAFYHTETAKEIGGYRPRIQLAEDWDLWLRLSEKGQLACLKKPLVRIRKHANQISHFDSGARQMIDTQVAIVSYFLRQSHCIDPVASEKESEWLYFLNWVDLQVKKDGFLDRQKILKIAREKFYNKGNQLINVLSFSTYLLGSSYTPSLIKEKIFGWNISKRIAAEWYRVCHDNLF